MHFNRYANPINVIWTDDPAMPCRFNFGALVAIAFNQKTPNIEAVEAAVIENLEKCGLLESVVLEDFDRSFDSFEVEIGMKVPVQISQAVVQSCFEHGQEPAAYSIEL